MPLNNLYQNHWYSFNVGPVHFLMLNIDLYHAAMKLNASVMYEWIQEDLRVADSDENRKKHPWIIAMGHYPIYCGDPNDGGCEKPKNDEFLENY